MYVNDAHDRTQKYAYRVGSEGSLNVYFVHAPTNFRIRKLSQLIVVSQGEFVQDRDLDLDLESL